MTRRRRLAIAGSVGVLMAACGKQTPPASETSGVTVATTMSREQALDSARAFISRSSAMRHVFLDSTEIVAVDSIWRVTFRRRELVIPNVVTVDVNARSGAMRFPGDE